MTTETEEHAGLLERTEGEGAKAPVGSDSSQSASRSYVVLEETTLLDALRGSGFDIGDLGDEVTDALQGVPLYRKLGEPEARNTEHALRRAAKDHFEQGGEPLLIPVPAKMWRPTRVRVRHTQTVSID